MATVRGNGQKIRWKAPSIIPGFGITFGLSVTYLGLLVLLPVTAIFFKASSLGLEDFLKIVTNDRVFHAVVLSLWTALAAACINVVFGLLVAWVLVRYQFPGRRLVDACVDLPFALPTAVAGLALTVLYSRNGWLGRPLAELGFPVAYTPSGIVIALVFIGVPFVVRTIQPAIADLDRQIEEAAATLGAGRFRIFVHILLPALFPSVLTGFALAFGRAIGEYGSVIFIAGNQPYRTEIVPLMIVMQLEGSSAGRYAGAAAIGATLLVIAFMILLSINLVQAWNRRRYGHD